MQSKFFAFAFVFARSIVTAIGLISMVAVGMYVTTFVTDWILSVYGVSEKMSEIMGLFAFIVIAMCAVYSYIYVFSMGKN